MCDTLNMFTPNKPLYLDSNEISVIEDIEQRLENFSHILERSTEKEKDYAKTIAEQTIVISSLKEDNQNLVEENQKLRLVLQDYMENFACFVDNLKRTSALEQENLSLKKQIDQQLNEASDKIVDLELEKDRMNKLNKSLVTEVEGLKGQISNLKMDINKMNEFVMNSFQQTLACSREEKIKELEASLGNKTQENSELKSEIEKTKESYEKQLKQKTLEYELLKMDYQSAIVQNIQARQTNWKGEKGKSEKVEKTEKNVTTSRNQTNKKGFNMVATKPDNTTPNDMVSSRKAKSAYKRSAAIFTVKDEIENVLGTSDNDDDFEVDNNDASLNDDEEEEEEVEFAPKKGKRKAKEIKKKQQTKKIKKNENKELLLINRNTIQYHLFN